jgi:hypothetical protein
VAENQQMRLPLPIPTPSSGIADNSLLAATAEYEETKIKLLGDIHNSISSIIPKIDFITKIMSDELALAKAQVSADKLKAGEELEKNREKSIGERSVNIGKEVEKKSRSFLTVLTAFLIPAIIGFVSTLTDMSSPLGLLKGAIVSLAIWFGGRALLGLIVKGLATAIAAAFLFISKAFMTKIIAPLGAMIANSKLGQKIGGMFEKTIPSVGDGADRSTKPRAGTKTRAPSSPNKAGGFLKSIAGSGLLKGAGAMLLAAGAIFVLGEALEKFSNLKWETLAVAGTAIVGLATAVGILGMFLPFIIRGSAALALMGAALLPLAAALALTTPFLWGLGQVLDAISGVIDSVVGGIVSVLQTVSLLDPVQVLAAAGAIAALSGALVLLGGGSLISGLLNLFSGNPIKDLIELGNVAPNIVELAEVMADFGNIVEFFNDALDNLDGDKAKANFKLIRDGILMVGKALDEVSMIKLVAFSALTNMSSSKPVVSDMISPVSNNVSEAADRAGGYSYNRQEESISGTLKMGRASGPITYNGEVYFPDDDEYPDLAYKLESKKYPNMRSPTPQVVATGSSNMSMMGDLTSSVNGARTSSPAQPQIMSVNNMNSVNKNETNYKSTSMGSALQGDALRYVY